MCIGAQAYGMFVFNEETRTYWFNATSMEAETEFTLVGQLMGLAIYNSVILDAHFPHCLYLELLGRRPTFQVRPRTHPSFAHARPLSSQKGSGSPSWSTLAPTLHHGSTLRAPS